MSNVTSLRGGDMVTAEDISSLRRDGIDDEALAILYNSTHDAIQKLLIEEIAFARKITLVPEKEVA